MDELANGSANEAAVKTVGDGVSDAAAKGGEGVGLGEPVDLLKTGLSGAENSAKGPIAEVDLCKEWGIARELVRRFRLGQLEEGVDWRMDGARVVYLEAGIVQLKSEFQLGGGKKGAGVEDGAVVELVALKKCTCKNRKIVLCGLPGGSGGPQRVRVRSNEKFVPGMRVPARRVAGAAEDLWEFAGRRLPRTKGRY